VEACPHQQKGKKTMRRYINILVIFEVVILTVIISLLVNETSLTDTITVPLVEAGWLYRHFEIPNAEKYFQPQENTYWCWASALQFVINYFLGEFFKVDTRLTQSYIVSSVFGECVNQGIRPIDFLKVLGNISMGGGYEINAELWYDNSTVSAGYKIIQELQENKPVIIAFKPEALNYPNEYLKLVSDYYKFYLSDYLGPLVSHAAIIIGAEYFYNDTSGTSIKLILLDPSVGKIALSMDDLDKLIPNGLVLFFSYDLCKDEEMNCLTYYKDSDGDGYGVADDTKCLCSEKDLYTASYSGDCNDNDKNINPKAKDICDGKDNDCDGKIDEDCPRPSILSPNYGGLYFGLPLTTNISFPINYSLYNSNYPFGAYGYFGGSVYSYPLSLPYTFAYYPSSNQFMTYFPFGW